MKIAVISDSHGLSESIRKVMALCREKEVDRLIHCGDIGGPSVIDLFCELPTDFVMGNCDIARSLLTSRIEAKGGTCHGRSGTLQFEGINLAFLHGDDDELLEQTIASGKWDLVCYGHTHRHELSCRGETTILNPGALQRRWEAAGFYIVELPALAFSRVILDQ